MELRIQKIYVNELLNFWESEEFINFKHFPISLKRIKSYRSNPNSNKNLPVIYLGFLNEELVVYRSLLQDRLRQPDTEIAWLSGVWTHPRYRRKGFANFLLDEVFKDYSGNIFSTNLGASSFNLVINYKDFTLFKESNGHRFYYRFSLSEILPPKSKFFLKLKPFLKITDVCANFFLDLRLLFVKKSHNPNLENAVFDAELEEFISRHNQNSLFRRNVEEFKWILDFPWVEQRNEDEEHDKKYHFTTSAKRFYQKALIYKANGKIKGFLFYSVKNEILKIHYIFTNSELELEEFVVYILNLIRKEKVSYMMLTDERFIQKVKNKGGVIYSKVWKKGFFAGKKLLEDFPGLMEKDIYMGDGDTVFT